MILSSGRGALHVPGDFSLPLEKDLSVRAPPAQAANQAPPPPVQPGLRFGRGRVFFRVPTPMWKGRPERVEFRLSPKAVLDEIERVAIIASFYRRGGPVAEETIDRIGRRMEAELLGDRTMFEIAPQSSGMQDVDPINPQPLRWDWQVTPVRTGRSHLRIRVSIREDLYGERFDFDTAPYERVVDVRIESLAVEGRRWWRDNWKWAFPTGSSAFGGLAWLAGFL